MLAGQRQTAANREALLNADPHLAVGQQLYNEHCAACHGIDGEGRPNPMAEGQIPPPPHDSTGHTWHHADAFLFEYTKYGGMAGMPAFEDELTDFGKQPLMFFWLDIVGGLAIPIGLIAARRLDRLDEPLYRVFWLGGAFGLVWETAAHVVDIWFWREQLVVHLAEWPLPMIMMPLIHALWDGLLFTAGVFIVQRVTPAPHFQGWRWDEWGILAVWGVGTCFIVETLAALTRSWQYDPRVWNPTLYVLNEVPVTILPFALWMVAATVFYAVLLLHGGWQAARHTV
ncbi:MAG: c-type cytochrome [Anaerolineae bacterium]